MITPHELRLGNLVDYEKTTHTVSGIDDELISSRWYRQAPEEVDYTDTPANYEPIPLTAEILEQWCGISKNGFNQFNIELPLTLTASFRRIIVDFNAGYAFLEEGEDPRKRHLVCVWNRDMQRTWSVHQLQNLYFALTGTDLKIIVPAHEAS